MSTQPRKKTKVEPSSPRSIKEAKEDMDLKDALVQVEKKLVSFRKIMNAKKYLPKKCARLLNELKLLLTNFQTVPPFTGDPTAIEKQLSLARETYEWGVLLAVKQESWERFERNFAQLKPFYIDYCDYLRESPRHWPLLGLNLLGLLAHNRIAEFHTELELIDEKNRELLYIKYSMELEQKMMEGAYSKVLSARKALPQPYYSYFAELLMKAVREKIQDCSEKAYNDVPLDDAAEFLMLEKKEEVLALVAQRKWRIQDGLIHFTHQKDHENVIPAHRLVQQTLQYATELERII